MQEEKTMNFKDISADDVLSALGLQTRRTTTDYIMPALGIFGVGLLVGAGIGMLFAPKTGHEIRSQIGSLARRRKAREGEEEVESEIHAGEAAE